MGQGFEVCEYSIAALEQLIASKSSSSPDIISGKLHKLYFDGYFSDIKARTIVVENYYIDHDYLEDFAGYYVRCFSPYERTCTRLHFFDTSFTKDIFNKFLKAESEELDCNKLQSAYLGFIVVKPIPQTAIGRTCLKTYESENRRHFPITRWYKASLFGLDLKVKTLAFQEQDKAVAACATSALWSVFHGTGMLFQHPILSPVEITKAATEQFPIESRTMPNKGLSAAMMARAIRNVGLEPFLVNVQDEYILKSTLYAYLRGEIPMILGIELMDVSSKLPRSRGYHAVAATGYSLGQSNPIPYGPSGFLSKATRIDKLYVHDDQVGPFARMSFDGVSVRKKVHKDESDRASLTTSWIGESAKPGSVRAIPDILLIPLYHKIRIPFGSVHDSVYEFDMVIRNMAKATDLEAVLGDACKLEWDIYLTTVNELKREILCSKKLGDDYFKEVLLENMPRFMWRATAYAGKTIALDLLFDATDIEQGKFIVRVIEYDKNLALFLRAISKIVPAGFGELADRIFKWFTR